MATAWDGVPLTTAALLAYHQGRTETSFLTEHHAKDPWDFPPPTVIMSPTEFKPGGARAAARLPNEIKYQILVDLSRVDPSCAFDVMMTCRRMARFVYKDPYSGLKQIVRIGKDECKDYVRTIEAIKHGRLDPLTVKGTFKYSVEDREHDFYKIKYRGKVINSLDLYREANEPCYKSFAQHFWSNSLGRMMPSAIHHSPVTNPAISKVRREPPRLEHVMRPVVCAPRNGYVNDSYLSEAPVIRWSRPRNWTVLIESEEVWETILVKQPRYASVGCDFRTFLVELSPKITRDELNNMARMVERIALRLRREEGRQTKPPFFVVFIHHSLGNCRKDHEWTEAEALRQCVRDVSGKPSWWSASDLQQISVEDAINLPSPHSISPHGAAQNVLLWNASFGDESMNHEPDWEQEAKLRKRLLETQKLPWPEIDEWDDEYWPSRPATPEAPAPKTHKKHTRDGDDWQSDADSEEVESGKEDESEEEEEDHEDEEMDSAKARYYEDQFPGYRLRETPTDEGDWDSPPPSLQSWKAEPLPTTPPWAKVPDDSAHASKQRPDPPKAPKSTKPFTPQAAAAAAAASSSSPKLQDKKPKPQPATKSQQRPSPPSKAKEPAAPPLKKTAASGSAQPQPTTPKRAPASGSAQRPSTPASSGRDKKKAKKDKGQAVWVNGELQYLSPDGPRLGDRWPRRTPPRDASS